MANKTKAATTLLTAQALADLDDNERAFMDAYENAEGVTALGPRYVDREPSTHEERVRALQARQDLHPAVRQRAIAVLTQPDEYDKHGHQVGLEGRVFDYSVDPVTRRPALESSADPALIAAVKIAKAQVRRERRARRA